MAKDNPFAEVNRLRALSTTPDAQADYAAELVTTSRHREAVLAALKVLAREPRAAARPALLERYAALDAEGVKRDQGAYLRTGIILALRPIARQDDVVLLERAALTYEVLPTSPEDVTGPLRAAALVVLERLDADRASWHGVRLLNDPRAAAMSGEPAVTAAHVLAACGQPLPIYGYAMRSDGHPEVVAEALRALTALPPLLLADLVAKLAPSEHGIILVGLFDLLLDHPHGADHVAALQHFLRTTDQLDVYRYVVAIIVARRDGPFLAAILEVAATETDAAKVEILLESLELIETEPTIRHVTQRLRAQSARSTSRR